METTKTPKHLKIKLDPDLHQRLRIYCIERDTTMQEQIELLVAKLVDGKAAPP